MMWYRNFLISAFCIVLLLATGCGGSSNDDSFSPGPISSGDMPIADDQIPIVTAESTYPVLLEQDIIYADGLGHDEASLIPFAIPLKLDVYSPDNNVTNRPLFMFIHGGGFTGGIKHKPEIVEMANYYASRGWVFVSIDYRTTEELCNAKESTLCRDKLTDMLLNDAQNGTDEVITFYQGIAPKTWIEHAIPAIESPKELQQSIAMYAAQRDSKAALRWLVANSSTYHINTDFITVGGASAGAVTTIALGISNQDDFRDEISIIDDPTLSTTNLDQNYNVRSMVYFWGSNQKLDLFEDVYDLQQYDRYDTNDPELFMGHGEAYDRVTPYEGALELQDIYDSLGLYSELKTLMVPSESDPSILVPAGHGAWNGEVDGKGLSELTFDFIVNRQNLMIENVNAI